MKNILIHHNDFLNNNIFNPDTRDNFNDPFVFLKQKLYLMGYDLKTSDNHPLTDCEWVIFFDAPNSKSIHYGGMKRKFKELKNYLFKKEKKDRDIYYECIKNNFNNIALILWEGKSIRPENFSKRLHKKFSYIFTWNDDYVDNKKIYKFYHPIARQLPVANRPPFGEKKLLVNISMNKYSSYSKELYSARRKSIEYFEKNFPNDFDLYGRSWNVPVTRMQKIFPKNVIIHPSYRGQLDNKAEVLSNYRFSLCYENMREEKGYISEKIFDCMRYGVVPIYWGASNVTDFIDVDSFIDRRLFKTDVELADYITNISEAEYNNYLRSIEIFLNSQKYQKFLPENFANTIINTLNLKALC